MGANAVSRPVAPWLVIPVALGLPILAVLYYRRCRSPRARLLALLSHDEYTTEKALAAHRLISETPQLAPALAGCDGRVDMDECALRVLGAAPHDQRQSTNLRHCLGFASELSHLRTALTRQRVAFDGGNAAHVELIRSMWLALVPAEEFATVSEEWERLGFQGPDPATDFRGPGCLAARELSHFALRHTEVASRLVREWAAAAEAAGPPRPLAPPLPLALTGINASSWLWDLLAEGRLDRPLLARGVSVRTYRELYCELLLEFILSWAREPPESIMEFERAQQTFLAAVRGRLDKGAERLSEARSGRNSPPP